MVDKSKIAKLVGPRQKRIKSWQNEILTSVHAQPDWLARFREKLETYGLMLAKLGGSVNEGQLEETLEKVYVAERELNTLAEDFRLETAMLNTPLR